MIPTARAVFYYNNEEVAFPSGTQAFDMITRLQDEAHRFAIEYHRSLRSKSQVHSVLDDIPGIGPARRKNLMGTFKDIQKIREASIEELMAAPSMNRQAAEARVPIFPQGIRYPCDIFLESRGTYKWNTIFFCYDVKNEIHQPLGADAKHQRRKSLRAQP